MASQLRVDKIVPVDGVPSGGGGGIVQVKSVSNIIEETILEFNETCKKMSSQQLKL